MIVEYRSRTNPNAHWQYINATVIQSNGSAELTFASLKDVPGYVLTSGAWWRINGRVYQQRRVGTMRGLVVFVRACE